MVDKRPEADRILIAKLTGPAKRHARWRDLTEAEHAAAVADLRELAAGRADLLAEVTSADDVPDGLQIPRWSWGGLVSGTF